MKRRGNWRLATYAAASELSLRIKCHNDTRDIVFRAALQSNLNQVFGPSLGVGELLRTLPQVIVADMIGQAITGE